MNKEHGTSATAKGAEGHTDWEKLRALPDSQVHFSDDAPATAPEDWTDALAHTGLPVPSRKTQTGGRLMALLC